MSVLFHYASFGKAKMQRLLNILHTSDWHLGQKFAHFDRREEHRLALDWLLDTMTREEVDVLLLAGDVFDLGSPPSYAEEQYYRFLAGLSRTPCRQVVITAGNHDSPAHLEAPRTLLQALNVHVRVRSGEDELIVLRDEKNRPEAVIAAVPFLRDRDLGTGLAAEAPEERLRRLRQRIKAHYQRLGKRAEPYTKQNIPIIAMGHLYARGSEVSDPQRQQNIYLGDEKNIAASDFPSVFRYVALGHIHRAQAVEGDARVHYSGSLIPLSFRETKDDKSVLLTAWEGGQLKEVRPIAVPAFRRLKTLKGKGGPELMENMRAFAKRHTKDQLRPWLELVLLSGQMGPSLRLSLQEEAQKLQMEVLSLRLEQEQNSGWMPGETQKNLEQWSPKDVFEERCKQAHLPEGQIEKLRQTFDELLEWMQQKEENA